MWKFKNIETYNSNEELFFESNFIAYHGDCSLDDRGEFVMSLFNSSDIENKVLLKYNELDFHFTANNKTFNRSQ